MLPGSETTAFASSGTPVALTISREVMAIMATDLERQLTGLKQGDHICPIYENAAEQMAVAVPFLKEGLVRAGRCLYIPDDQTALRIPQPLNAAPVHDTHHQLRDS